MFTDMAKRDAPPSPGPAGWTDYRPVTAMFVDLEGSVALLSRLGPEAYSAALRAFHSLVTRHVGRRNGEVVQYLGDGVMCIFQRDWAEMDRASAAIAAGTEIIAAMHGLDEPQPGNARIGIASGLALFHDDKTTHAGARVIGSCINLAARLQAEAAPGRILICDESRRVASAHFRVKALEARHLKGFDDQIRVWQVQGRNVKAGGRRQAIPAANGAPFVGRDAETAQLQQALEGTIAGQAHSVAILGEAGIGKSRLTHEFLQSATAQGCTTLVLRCCRDESGLDFHPIRSFLDWTVGVAPGDPDQTRSARLDRLLRTVWGLDPGQVADMLQLLGAQPADDTARPAQSPVVLRRWLHGQLITRLAQMRGNHPAMVLVLEDAHWVDPSTAELFAGLASHLGPERILLVFTQRMLTPDDPPAFAADCRLRLAPLSARQSTRIIQTILEGQNAGSGAVTWICNKARGVPLFVAAFAEFARRQTDHADLSKARLPLDLLDLVEQSLGRLPSPTRRFVQTAAVQGSVFEPALTAALLGEGDDAMADHIARLSREQIIIAQPNASGLSFAHDLLRQAIYENLGNSLRRELHAACAELIAARGAPAPAHLLALHLERAGRPKEAIAHYHAASLSSAQVGALQEARNYLNQAFALLEQLSSRHERLTQELMLRNTEGPLHMVLGGPGNPVFGAAQRRSMELSAELGLTDERPLLLYNSGLHDWACLRLPSAARRAHDILSLPGGGDEVQLAGHTLAGLVAWHMGENHTARDHLARTLALYRTNAHQGLFHKYLKDLSVFSLFYAGLTAAVCGDQDGARDFAERAEHTGKALEIPHAACFGLVARFSTALLRGDADRAQHHALRAETLAHTYGFPEFEAMAVFTQGWAESRSDAGLEAGIARMAKGLNGWKKTDFLAWQSLYESILIEALTRAGRLAQAQDYLDSLHRRVAQHGDEHQFTAPALTAEAKLLAARRKMDAARACLTRAIDFAKGRQAALWQRKAERALAQIDGGSPA